MLHCEGITRHDMSSLQRFACMGAPIPRHYGSAAKEKLPNMVLLGGWGQTECGLSSFGHPDDPEEKICLPELGPRRLSLAQTSGN